MDREWGYDERAPRDRRSARTWSTPAEPTDGDGVDRWWFTPENKTNQPPSPEHAAWYDDSYDAEYRDRNGSWPANDGWLPRQHPEPLQYPEPRQYPEPERSLVPYERPAQHARLPATHRPYDPVRIPYPTEDEVEPTRGQFASLLMTLIWYAAPISLYLLWALLLGGTPDPNCVDDAGNQCPAPRDAALTTMADSAPRLATALALSLVVAIIIRWITGTWRATTVGFASSVVGAGIATVIFSVLARTTTGG
ncbi:MAG TPA: hypothetical protein VFC00_09210 [Micromonosporaceae bacterium]|nr:hypothetical protein [Micromonosporaceae bacterium]